VIQGGLTVGIQTDLKQDVLNQLRRARAVVGSLSQLSTDQKNLALQHMSDALWSSRERILAANQADVADALAAGQSDTRIDRLKLDETRIQSMMTGLMQISKLPDPVGERIDSTTLPNGLNVEKVRVPLGVIAIVYESRPNVTVDAAALALKSGNVAVLRGGKEARKSNQALVDALRDGLRRSNVPEDAIQLIQREEREAVDFLIQATGLVDVAIPRGGSGLIQRVVEQARVPVIETGVGNCHVYVDARADATKATHIVLNAKTQRPSVCNAAETLLVHQGMAESWLPHMLVELQQMGVEIRGCEQTRLYALKAGLDESSVQPATEEDWATEFLAPILAVKVVANVDEAIDHIHRYGTLHSEAIVTEDAVVAEQFLSQVDAAVVYHNASTRFTDGFEFGFGAEIGISTQKIHARGPMGLRELTSYKYIVRGNGQVRE
jgi:glutamate-5-semialdehyde dehydrogenase